MTYENCRPPAFREYDPSRVGIERFLVENSAFVFKASVRDNVERLDDRLLLVTVLASGGPAQLANHVYHQVSEFLSGFTPVLPQMRVFVAAVDIDSSAISHYPSPF